MVPFLPRFDGTMDAAQVVWHATQMGVPLFVYSREGKMVPERRSRSVAKLRVLLHPIPVLWFQWEFVIDHADYREISGVNCSIVEKAK